MAGTSKKLRIYRKAQPNNSPQSGTHAARYSLPSKQPSPETATMSVGVGHKWRYILACRGPFLGGPLPKDPVYNAATAGHGGGEFVEYAGVWK